MHSASPNLETRQTLINRLATDPESWNEFVTLYRPLLEAYIGDCNRRENLALSDHDREDVVQEVLTKLIQKIGNFKLDKSRGRFRTWLWTVTYHETISWVRRHRRRLRVLKGGAPDGEQQRQPIALVGDFDRDLVSKAPQPDEEAINTHLRHTRMHILAKVREEMRGPKWECFERHFLNGQPSAQVGQALGLSVSAVNTATSRVLARIRELYVDYDVD